MKNPTIHRIDVSAYTIPTDFPESDGTFEWDSTTLILVEAHGGGQSGLGYTYGDLAAAGLIQRVLAPAVVGRDVMAVAGAWSVMNQLLRNVGRPGIGTMAIAAVDSALWDLKAPLLNLPLVTLLGSVRNGIPVYGSGGFTSYPLDRLQQQLGEWVNRGISRVKMKVGREPTQDLPQVEAARSAIGPNIELFVDANGAYTRKQALRFAESFAQYGVTWFEEPVPSDDLDGLRLLRNRAPAGMAIAAGEYGYDSFYFRRMLEAGSVDILQADATRCGGITGFLQAGVLAAAHHVPLSAHTAPSLHAHVCCAIDAACHVEYFHDHVRIEKMLFDGILEPVEGMLCPDLSRPGLGIHFKRRDAAKYAA
jgi:L-alanine-DL-glutamate epimerase-like enolase superfamily enzyme